MWPYSSLCYTHRALREIYFWKDSYFMGHVVCMSYDMLVTMVKKGAFLLKEVTLTFCSMVLTSFWLQCFFREELKNKWIKEAGKRGEWCQENTSILVLLLSLVKLKHITKQEETIYVQFNCTAWYLNKNGLNYLW